eukprot:CAMPEP_0172830106 /NCGR_PEP_ID=MMETSP1075-20121228/22004_1 /TAXON_ID=2916 /ORGANISM="Ceratium fusus, Strain PA161109" /LENGTH=62 /DNA_ID=CAMNT_0013672341 /DNA_START=203 /DNA_END=388 /DNA_ORIENTATION=-
MAEVEGMLLHDYFGSVDNAILTLFMSLTGGLNWEKVFKQLEDVSIFWSLFFLVFISFCYLAV